VAGDEDFGREVERVVEEALFEFLKYPDLAPEILRMRGRIEAERARTGPGRLDLKYAAGGIIDAEFLAQYLALREGGRRRSLRGGATARVLRAAGEEGLLRDAGDAVAALETLRRSESALRLVTGRAESVLELESPVAPLVAQLVGAPDVETLAESIRDAEARLRAIFAREIRA
jgi:glutamate-ammonia-ligase adenylyltransferase